MSDLPPLKCRVAGITFDNRDGSPRQRWAWQARRGDRLALRREPDNPFDPNAIAVDWTDVEGVVHQIGYVPRALAALLAPMADDGGFFTAEVIRRGRVQPPGGGPAIVGLRMALEGDLSGAPHFRHTGFEPAIAKAMSEDAQVEALEVAAGLAPALGGKRAAAEATAEVRQGPPGGA